MVLLEFVCLFVGGSSRDGHQVMDGKLLNNFRCYVDIEQKRGSQQGDIVNDGCAQLATRDGARLVAGEAEVARAEGVQLLASASVPQAVSGCLLVTNFKLSFQPDIAASPTTTIGPGCNSLIGTNDLCLANIDQVYQLLSSNGRRKLLSPHSVVAGRIKGLLIRCKDFRFLNVSFCHTPLSECRAVVNALLVYVFPRMSRLLFVFYHPVRQLRESCACDFNTPDDWQAELARSSARGWRVSVANRAYTLSPSLPAALVVPQSLSDADLSRHSGDFSDGRLPVWCWSHSNGAAILRSALPSPSSARHSENRWSCLDSLSRLNKEGRCPLILDASSRCPSVEELRESYCRLRELCVPESAQAVVDGDCRWLGQLAATRWPHAVQSCLSAAVHAVKLLHTYVTSVVIADVTGRDLSAVLSSLVQLLLDSQCRTVLGFQRLVDKEWVSLGHPFQQRNALVFNDIAEQSPVFLLFLDCVHQLLVQFPGEFEFTEHYLLSVWDFCLVPAFDTFLFNSHRERFSATTQTEGEVSLVRRSVWDWNQTLSVSSQLLFFDPLYELLRLDITPASTTQSRLFNSHSQNRPEFAVDAVPLWPCSAMCWHRPWLLCFCRWLPALNVPRSGLLARAAGYRRLLEQLRRLDASRAGVSLRASQADLSLPNSLYPFIVSDTVAPMLAGSRRLVDTLVRNSIVAPAVTDRF